MKKFRKPLLWIVLWLATLWVSFATVQKWNSSTLELSQKRMLFTDTGLPTGNKIMDINNSGHTIMYKDLVFSGNSGSNLDIQITWVSMNLWGTPTSVYIPVISPTAYIPLMWGNEDMRAIRWRNFYIWKPWDDNIQHFYLNSTGDEWRMVQAKTTQWINNSFTFMPFTWGIPMWPSTPEISIIANGTIRTTATGTSLITDPGHFITKAYFNANSSGVFYPYSLNPAGYLTWSALIGIGWGMNFKGGRDASTNVLPTYGATGDLYVVQNSGTVWWVDYYNWNQIIANWQFTGWSLPADWTLVLISTTEVDPVFMANSWVYYTQNPLGYITWWALAPYITGVDLTPYVLKSQTGNWNTAYGRWNHAIMWYLTWSALSWYLTGWALSGYLTGVTNYWTFGTDTLSSNTPTPSLPNTMGIKIGLWGAVSSMNGISIGRVAQSLTNYAVAIWAYSIARSISSIAIWNDTEAIWLDSVSMWQWTTAVDANSSAYGQYNVWVPGAVFEVWVGVGMWASDRRNAITILWTDKMWLFTTTPTRTLTVSWDINVTTWYNIYDWGWNVYITWGALPTQYRQMSGTKLSPLLTVGSFAAWFAAAAIGVNSLALNGWSAQSDWCIAIGPNVCLGKDSVTIGNGAFANKPSTIAMGIGTRAYGMTGMLAIGRYNVWQYDTVFELGIGTWVSNRANAMTVLSSGNVWIGTTHPTQRLDVAGSIQTNTSMIMNNWVDAPFRFAYSGGLVEGQYYTGSQRVSAVRFTLP